MSTTEKTPMLNSSAYDKLRNITQYWLPGLGAFYFSMASIWGFPYGEQVIGSLAALGILFGVLMGVSNKTYKESDARFDGTVEVELRDPTKDTYTLEVNTPFDLMKDQETVLLKVNKSPDEDYDWSSR